MMHVYTSRELSSIDLITDDNSESLIIPKKHNLLKKANVKRDEIRPYSA